MLNKNIRVQVSGVRESESAYSALVDLILNDKGECTSAMRQVWFLKSVCTLEVEEPKSDHNFKSYYINAPKWYLEKNNIKWQ